MPDTHSRTRSCCNSSSGLTSQLLYWLLHLSNVSSCRYTLSQQPISVCTFFKHRAVHFLHISRVVPQSFEKSKQHHHANQRGNARTLNASDQVKDTVFMTSTWPKVAELITLLLLLGGRHVCQLRPTACLARIFDEDRSANQRWRYSSPRQFVNKLGTIMYVYHVLRLMASQVRTRRVCSIRNRLHYMSEPLCQHCVQDVPFWPQVLVHKVWAFSARVSGD